MMKNDGDELTMANVGDARVRARVCSSSRKRHRSHTGRMCVLFLGMIEKSHLVSIFTREGKYSFAHKNFLLIKAMIFCL